VRGEVNSSGKMSNVSGRRMDMSGKRSNVSGKKIVCEWNRARHLRVSIVTQSATVGVCVYSS